MAIGVRRRSTNEGIVRHPGKCIDVSGAARVLSNEIQAILTHPREGLLEIDMPSSAAIAGVTLKLPGKQQGGRAGGDHLMARRKPAFSWLTSLQRQDSIRGAAQAETFP